MISEKQRLERLQKFSKILVALPDCNSIGEISEVTNIPTSTIQRYLNDKKLYEEFFLEAGMIKEDNVDELFERIQSSLKEYKQNGLSKGGKKSQELHGYEKDENGKFRGGRK